MPLLDVERERLLANADLFILKYFSHRIERLEEFHLRLIENATTKPRGLILYPAAHGKTTLVSTMLPIWGLCKDPNIRIAIIAKNDQDADSIGQAIQSELLGNEDLIRDFGPFQPAPESNKPFATKRMSIAKRTRIDKQATIVLFGAGSRNALGHRSDWTICDDIIHDLNSASPGRRQTMAEWFMQGPATMAEDPDDRLTVVGTLFDPEDLYHDLMQLCDADSGLPLYHVQREDAIVDEEEHTTLWPTRWPWKRLMERKGEMGTLDFNKRYRNIAVDKSRMVFKEQYIKGGWIGKEKYPGCLDHDHIVGNYDPLWQRFAGFDPAVGITRSAKFCAHVVLAVGSCAEHDKCYWVVDLHRDQLTLPQQADLIIRLHTDYDLLSSMVEANSYQGGLYQAIQERMEQRGLALRVEPHYTTRTNKPDPELGVQAMSPWFENGKVHIPWGNQESRRKMQQLVDELVQYPGRTTDTVMATWFAWKASRDAQPAFASFNRLAAKRKTWARQLSRRTVSNPYYEREPVADRA